MPRRLGLLFAVVGLCAAVAIVAWLQNQGAQTGTEIPVTLNSNDWIQEPSEVSVDPAAAVATILDLRAEFGSVLDNSELEPPVPSGPPVEATGEPNSFDDFLWAEAGVDAPEPREPEARQVAVEWRKSDRTLPSYEVAQSMRETAMLLVEQARQARELGDLAQQQRFSGLATLLRAEADAMAIANQAGR